MNINISGDNSTINDFLIIFEELKKRPHKFLVHDVFSSKEFYEAIDVFDPQIKCQENELIKHGQDYLINRRKLIRLPQNIWISYLETDPNSDESAINEVCFYYEHISDESKVFDIIEKFSSIIDNFEDDEQHNIKYLTQINNVLQLVNFNQPTVEISGFYNKSIVKKLQKLAKQIDKKQKGLSIFCGERGLGKTEAIKWISQQVEREVIFIPYNLVDLSINNPDFKNLLQPNKKYLLLIDDCEFLYSFGKNNFFTANILQLIDGFLSGTLNLQIVLIYNQDLDEIDQNIVDCNNLIEIIEFDYLDAKIANSLSEDLEIKQTFNESVKLIDVLNHTKFQKQQKIGLN
jgi:hypothetical protein